MMNRAPLFIFVSREPGYPIGTQPKDTTKCHISQFSFNVFIDVRVVFLASTVLISDSFC